MNRREGRGARDSSVVRHRSAGGVVVRRMQEGCAEVCLILRERSRQENAWCLPKGHIEAGEDASAAALREVQEETGLVGQIVAPLGEIAYTFRMPKDRRAHDKTVAFFLMRATGGSIGPADQEALEARWIPFEQALQMATYDNERQILRLAQQKLVDRLASNEPRATNDEA